MTTNPLMDLQMLISLTELYYPTHRVQSSMNHNDLLLCFKVNVVVNVSCKRVFYMPYINFE